MQLRNTKKGILIFIELTTYNNGAQVNRGDGITFKYADLATTLTRRY